MVASECDTSTVLPLYLFSLILAIVTGLGKTRLNAKKYITLATEWW